MQQIITIPSSTAYSDLYVLAGIANTRSLMITNNTSDPIFVNQSTLSPPNESQAFVIYENQTVLIQATGKALWVRGNTGPVIVQTFTDTIIPVSGIDPRVYSGDQAFTVQSFTEANCKNGTQYELSTYDAAFAAGTNRDFIVITGNKPILIKNRFFQFTGSQITTNIYKNPIYTGGTPVTYYNLSDRNPVLGTVQILSTPTVTNTGTQISPTTVILGNIPQTGQAIVASNAENSVSGLERVLNSNSVYLFRVTNSSANSMFYSTRTTWYEGGLSVNQQI